MFRKNVASQTIGFTAINASTGATMTGTTGFAAYRVIDGGAQASATGTVTDKGNGQYTFALSQADTNGNDISILFIMTGMVAVEKTFVTTACDPTSAAFGLSIAKTTNITGFNDIAATAIVSGGAITTSSGAVGSVAGAVTLDLTQAIPASNTAGTLGDSLNAARAQGFGKWILIGTTLTVYGADGTTPVRVFTLDSSTAPTSRT